MAERPVQQEDGGSNPTPSLHVRRLDFKTAEAFIEKWHYSHNAPSGKNVCFGWFIGDVLYAVASYGHGANMNDPWKFLKRTTGLPVKKSNLYELKRLCRVEPDSGYPLTKFLSVCHRMLKKEDGIRFIISFSDPTHNTGFTPVAGREYNSGGIYRAANFKHLGKTSAEMHVINRDGEIIHRRVAYKRMWRENLLHCVSNGVTVDQLRKGWRVAANREKWAKWAVTLPEVRKQLGYKPFKTEAKDRWFLDLGE